MRAVTARGIAHSLPGLTLTRGARHLAFVSGGRTLAFLRREMHRQNLWLVDLDTGTEQQLTHLDPDFDVLDFDISPEWERGSA